jgi:hypothetical protein
MAKNPTKAWIKGTPSSKKSIPKVNRRCPAMTSYPTVESINPRPAEINPLHARADAGAFGQVQIQSISTTDGLDGTDKAHETPEKHENAGQPQMDTDGYRFRFNRGLRRFTRIKAHRCGGRVNDKKIDTLWKINSTEEVSALTKVKEEITKKFPEFPFYKDIIHDLSQIYNLPSLNRRPIELKVKRNIQISGKILGGEGQRKDFRGD